MLFPLKIPVNSHKIEYQQKPTKMGRQITRKAASSQSKSLLVHVAYTPAPPLDYGLFTDKP